eukprot:PhF_6_TR40364/c2_g1_i1/m.60075
MNHEYFYFPNMKCRKGHELHKETANPYSDKGRNPKCDLCKQVFPDYANGYMRCDKCRYDACSRCVFEYQLTTAASSSTMYCKKKHELTRLNASPYPGGRNPKCNVCKKVMESEMVALGFFHCATCNFDECGQCVVAGGIMSAVIAAPLCPKSHEMKGRKESIYEGGRYPKCNVCKVVMENISSIGYYNCRKCKYDLCMKCYANVKVQAAARGLGDDSPVERSKEDSDDEETAAQQQVSSAPLLTPATPQDAEIQSCMTENRLYIDNDFPPQESSLFRANDSYKSFKDITWKRAGEVVKNPTLVMDGFDPNDIN